MTKKQLEKFRSMLIEMKQNLINNARKTLEEETVIDTSELPDELDLASSEYAQSMIFRLRDREKFLFKKIEKALDKIDKKEFGKCESCGEEIPLKRLEARPVTDLCIRCKEEEEHREKAFA